MNFPFQLLRKRLEKADINLLVKMKVFMFDCDGVLWRGKTPIRGAVETLRPRKEHILLRIRRGRRIPVDKQLRAESGRHTRSSEELRRRRLHQRDYHVAFTTFPFHVVRRMLRPAI